MSRHCLVTGASSQIGDVLLPLLHRQGYQVIAWSRQRCEDMSHAASVLWVNVDLLDPVAIPEQVCTLLHLASVELLPDLLEKQQMFFERPRSLRIIAISSCSVTAKAHSPSSCERDQAERLAGAEQRAQVLAKRYGHDLTILRPTMLYGVGRDGTVAVMQHFVRRYYCLPLPTQSSGLRQPVHVADVAAAIVLAVESQASIGQVYELGGAERLSVKQLARRIFIDNQRRPCLVLVPLVFLRIGIYFMRYFKGRADWSPALLVRAKEDQLADNTRACTDFGYAPRPFDGRWPVGQGDAC